MRPGPEPDPEYVRPLDRANTRAIDRTGGTVLHTSRTNPRKMSEGAPPAVPRGGGARASRRRRWRLRPHATRPAQHRCAPAGLSRDDRWRRHAVVFRGARCGGRASYRRAEDDGQRRTRHGVLHRLLDGDHAREGAHRPAAHHARLPRAHRRLPHLRTRRRVQRAARRIRDVGRCLIPESPFDLDRLVEILVEDKRNNPSRYAFVVAAEGAVWKGGTIPEYGPADAFGHRHKTNIAETIADEIRKRSGEETLASELTYDLRSGDPDALDQTVAITFANIAVDLIRDGASGRMVAIQGGNFVHTTLPDPSLGRTTCRCRSPVQRRALPSAVRRTSRRVDLPLRARGLMRAALALALAAVAAQSCVAVTPGPSSRHPR